MPDQHACWVLTPCSAAPRFIGAAAWSCLCGISPIQWRAGGCHFGQSLLCFLVHHSQVCLLSGLADVVVWWPDRRTHIMFQSTAFASIFTMGHRWFSIFDLDTKFPHFPPAFYPYSHNVFLHFRLHSGGPMGWWSGRSPPRPIYSYFFYSFFQHLLPIRFLFIHRNYWNFRNWRSCRKEPLLQAIGTPTAPMHLPLPTRQCINRKSINYRCSLVRKTAKQCSITHFVLIAITH